MTIAFYRFKPGTNRCTSTSDIMVFVWWTKGVARSLEFAENLLKCSQSVLANNNWAHHTIFRPHNVPKTQLALVTQHPIYAMNMCTVHTVGQQHLHNKFGMSPGSKTTFPIHSQQKKQLYRNSIIRFSCANFRFRFAQRLINTVWTVEQFASVPLLYRSLYCYYILLKFPFLRAIWCTI